LFQLALINDSVVGMAGNQIAKAGHFDLDKFRFTDTSRLECKCNWYSTCENCKSLPLIERANADAKTKAFGMVLDMQHKYKAMEIQAQREKDEMDNKILAMKIQAGKEMQMGLNARQMELMRLKAETENRRREQLTTVILVVVFGIFIYLVLEQLVPVILVVVFGIFVLGICMLRGHLN